MNFILNMFNVTFRKVIKVHLKGYFGTALIKELIQQDFEVTAFGSVRSKFYDLVTIDGITRQDFISWWS